MAVSGLHDHVGFWLRFVSNSVSQGFARKVETLGVTVAEWVILREMYDRKDVAPSDLAEAVGLTRGAVSKLVDRLVRKRLLLRMDSEGDRRYQSLALTPVGRRLVPKLAALADRNDEEFFAALSPRERKALLVTLRNLVAVHGLSSTPID